MELQRIGSLPVLIASIIIKRLPDKRELDSLHGRITADFLIGQDICVTLRRFGGRAIVVAWMSCHAPRPPCATCLGMI
ncbi:MAG TPA: hypothetical protein VMW07_08620 [Gallionella sp.]|nr:hypothetical protein [Gallionella sp.]